jgi:hypothetical protein
MSNVPGKTGRAEMLGEGPSDAPKPPALTGRIRRCALRGGEPARRQRRGYAAVAELPAIARAEDHRTPPSAPMDRRNPQADDRAPSVTVLWVGHSVGVHGFDFGGQLEHLSRADGEQFDRPAIPATGRCVKLIAAIADHAAS